MNDNIYWVIELKIKPGQYDTFQAVMTEMVNATKANEPGTTNYEWSVSSDKTVCHIYERYVDSPATLIHVTTFGKMFAQKFLAVLEPTRLTVYGNPSDEVKKALSVLNPVYMSPVGGFAR